MNRPAMDHLSRDVQEYIISLETNLEEQKNRIADLEIMLQNMQRMLFGKKSEKLVPQVPEPAGEQQSAQTRMSGIHWKLRKWKFLLTSGKRIPARSCSGSFLCSHRITCWTLRQGTATNAAVKWISSAKNWSRKNLNSFRRILKSMNSTAAFTAASAVRTVHQRASIACLPVRNAARCARTGREPSSRKHSFRLNTDTHS